MGDNMTGLNGGAMMGFQLGEGLEYIEDKTNQYNLHLLCDALSH